MGRCHLLRWCRLLLTALSGGSQDEVLVELGGGHGLCVVGVLDGHVQLLYEVQELTGLDVDVGRALGEAGLEELLVGVGAVQVGLQRLQDLGGAFALEAGFQILVEGLNGRSDLR